MTTLVAAPVKDQDIANEHLITVDQIVQQVHALPQENLAELSRFIEFLQFKGNHQETSSAGDTEEEVKDEDEEPAPPLRIIRLGGLLKGYEFTPEEIAEARREMWKGLETFEL